jgi:hypothetical protein
LHLVDVVLVLADADRLRVDLDQLGERILQAARDRHRAAQAHVELGNSRAASSEAE